MKLTVTTRQLTADERTELEALIDRWHEQGRLAANTVATDAQEGYRMLDAATSEWRGGLERLGVVATPDGYRKLVK